MDHAIIYLVIPLTKEIHIASKTFSGVIHLFKWYSKTDNAILRKYTSMDLKKKNTGQKCNTCKVYALKQYTILTLKLTLHLLINTDHYIYISFLQVMCLLYVNMEYISIKNDKYIQFCQ